MGKKFFFKSRYIKTHFEIFLIKDLKIMNKRWPGFHKIFDFNKNVK